MDTVHEIVEDLTPVQLEGRIFGINKVTMQQSGIGGDDKVGVFIALECLKRFENIKVAFFHDEEVGCIGSYEADLSFFDDCRFVLQCDRRGNSDFVTNASGTQLSSKKFRKAISKIMPYYGYAFANGMMTDVMALKQSGLHVSCANISCGYYNPHSPDEYVVIDDVFNTYYFVCHIIEALQTTYKHSYMAQTSYNDYYSNYYYPRYNSTPQPSHPTVTKSRIHYELPQTDWFGRSDEAEINSAIDKATESKYCTDCNRPKSNTSDYYCDTCEEWYLKNIYDK
jgi:hypothetical protein